MVIKMTEKNDKPLYIQIIDYLINLINSKKILPDQKLPSEQELADLFGVSRITSKRALVELEREGLIYRIRGSGSFVSPQNPARDKDNKMLAFVLPFNSSVGRTMDTIKGATEYLKIRGYYLSIHSTDRSWKKEQEALNELPEQFAGIIYYPISDQNNLTILNNIYLNNYPIVSIDINFESVPINYVISDNFQGGYTAAEFLIKNGHRQIAYVSGVPIETRVSVRQRYFGYCKALKDYSIPLNSALIKLGNVKSVGTIFEMSNEQNKETKLMLEELLCNGVTAICTENDYVAINLERNCRHMGVQIPEQLSIIGFDNINLSYNIAVPLTTIEQDFYEIGKTAAEIVVKGIENNKYNYEKIVLPIKLIERQSTRAINNEITACETNETISW